MPVTVTPKAAKQIQKALTQRGSGLGLRVAVKTGGCSGYAYALEFVDVANPEDQVFASEGVSVLVVLIVRVPVVVRDGEVGVLVHVPLREVQPYSQGHEGGSDDQRHGH
mgnify:CR=1 FL=1